MKKLLALTGLAALLTLAACGGGSSSGDETVCTMEGLWGSESITVQSEDGEITSGTSEERIDISDWTAEEIADEIEWANENGLSYSESGDTLVLTETLDAEELQSMGIPLDLEEFTSAMEAAGGTCN